MADDSRATRRSVLGRGALLLGSLAGSLGLVSGVERVRDGGVQISSTPALAATRLVLHGTDWHLQGADLARGRPPRSGDRVSVSGQLATALGGTPTGAFHATSLLLDTPLTQGTRPGAVMEIHNFTLAEGTLVGIGAAAPGESGVFTVVGGSGRYLGATGSYVARQDPVETGGEGTAMFTFEIRLAEGRNGSR
jgi:hypothetical protein